MPLSALCFRSLLLEWVLQARDEVRVLSEAAKAMGHLFFLYLGSVTPLVLIMIPPNDIATGRSHVYTPRMSSSKQEGVSNFCTPGPRVK